MPKNIKSIMEPRSIAVVGATNREGSVGLAVFRNILQGGYKGILYPVNPTKRSVCSVRAYPNLADIKDDIDMAVVIIPAKQAHIIVKEAAAKNVKGLVIITAGFKETGGKGVELENQLKEMAGKHNIRILGPNCLGVVNTNENFSMNASFATKMPKKGNIAFLSQSGALCTAVLDFAEGENIGFSKFISFGNKADISEIDILKYLKDDPDTDVILMYVEDITHGKEFIEIAREITWEAQKPIMAIKSGRSAEGARAAASHTGSMAGSDDTYDAIFFQGGVLRVEGINDLFNYATAFANQPLPQGNKIAIITNAGGPGIIATDAAVRHGLALAELSDKTRQKLREHLPSTAAVNNPVDVIGDATHERYEAAIKATIDDEEVAGAIVILSPQAMTDVLETAEIVPRVASTTDKTILCAFMGIVDVSEGADYLETHGIPNYMFPEEAVRSMASMVRFGDLQKLERRQVKRFETDKAQAASIIQEALKEKDRYIMPQNEANEALECYGFPVLKNRLITEKSGAGKALEEIGPPVAMKIISPDIVHKFDAGGVVLDVNSPMDAKKAYERIIENAGKFNPDADIKGVMMERMARKGTEVIIGSARDPGFGPIVMFGLGGTLVEAFKDVTFRLAPMWEVSAEIMIDTIKAHKVLQGFRGMPPADVDAIKDCILRLSQMVSEHEEIAELDINPLIVYPKGEGCVAVDSRILLTAK